MNFLSSNIKYLRQSNNLKQGDLANMVGKARSLVSQWESDDRSITTEDIIKISNYFNISIDYLVSKDLRINNTNVDELEQLFEKDDEEMVKFIMNKTIRNYEEKNKR